MARGFPSCQQHCGVLTYYSTHERRDLYERKKLVFRSGAKQVQAAQGLQLVWKDESAGTEKFLELCIVLQKELEEGVSATYLPRP